VNGNRFEERRPVAQESSVGEHADEPNAGFGRLPQLRAIVGPHAPASASASSWHDRRVAAGSAR
jgi:hypothetical protein